MPAQKNPNISQEELEKNWKRTFSKSSAEVPKTPPSNQTGIDPSLVEQLKRKLDALVNASDRASNAVHKTNTILTALGAAAKTAISGMSGVIAILKKLSNISGGLDKRLVGTTANLSNMAKQVSSLGRRAKKFVNSTATPPSGAGGGSGGGGAGGGPPKQPPTERNKFLHALTTAIVLASVATMRSMQQLAESKGSGPAGSLGDMFSAIGNNITDMFRFKFSGDIFGGNQLKGRTSLQEATNIFRGAEAQKFTREPGFGIAAAIGADPDHLAKIGLAFSRTMGQEISKSAKMLDSITQTANKNGASAALTFKKIAENTNLFANAANRVDGSLARAAINSDRIGVSLQSMEKLADKFTANFENFLDAQALVQTIMPGTDLTQLAIASEFGGAEDLQNALLKTFGGTDLGQLPRSARQAISNALGLSLEEMVNLGKGPVKGGQVQKNTVQTEVDAAGQTIIKLVIGLGEIIIAGSLLKRAFEALALRTATINPTAYHMPGGPPPVPTGVRGISKAMWGGIATTGLTAGIMSGVDEYQQRKAEGRGGAARAGIIEGVAKGSGVMGGMALGAAYGTALGPLGTAIGGLVGLGVGALGGSLINKGIDEITGANKNIPKHHAGTQKLLPSETFAILQKGEAVLNRTQVEGLATLMTSIKPVVKGTPQVPSSIPSTNAIVRRDEEKREVNMAGMEKKMDELIALLQGGAISVNMDGRKVGDSLVKAFNRG